MTHATILIVEGDAILASTLRDLISRHGYVALASVAMGEEAIRVVPQIHPDLILMDLELTGELNGIQTAGVITKDHEIPVILLVGRAQEHLLQENNIFSPNDYILKPVSERELVACLRLALYPRELNQQLDTHENRFQNLIEHTSDGVFLLDSLGQITEVNPAGCAMLGRSREEIQKAKLSDFLTSDSGKSIFANHIETGSLAVHFESGLCRPDGDDLVVDINISRLKDGCSQSVVHDISDRKHLERESGQVNDLFHLFVQNVPAGIAMFDREMRYIAASRHYLHIYRLPEQNLIGRSHYEIFPEIPERWKEIHRRCLSGATESCAEDPFPRADGSLDWVRWRIEPWYESSGRIGGIVLFSEIITEQKRMLQELQESEQKFRDLFEKHAAVKLLVDPADGTIVDANLAAGQFYGWTIEQLKKMHVQDINVLAPDLIRAEMEKAKSLERIYFEFIHRMADGSQRDVEVYSSSVEIKGKTLLHSIVHDVTAKKKAAETLRVSEERFRILNELLPVGVYLTNAQGKILFANGQWLENTGLSLEEAQEKGGLASIHPEDREAAIAAWDKLVASKGKQGIEYRFLRPDGSIAWVYALASGQFDENGQLLGYIGVNIDITERKKADLLLNQQLDELRRWNEVTLGRETRILELKKEINQLLAQMGSEPRYASAEAGS